MDERSLATVFYLTPFARPGDDDCLCQGIRFTNRLWARKSPLIVNACHTGSVLSADLGAAASLLAELHHRCYIDDVLFLGISSIEFMSSVSLAF